MWYRFSETSISAATRKAIESIAISMVRGKLLSTNRVTPSDDKVKIYVNKIIKEIERKHGSLSRAALESPTVELKPVVEEAIATLKW